MSEQEIIERVSKIMVTVFEVKAEDLTPEVTLYDQLGLDSLDSVDLVVALEKEFGFKIVRETDEARISEIRQLKDIYDFIHYKQENAA